MNGDRSNQQCGNIVFDNYANRHVANIPTAVMAQQANPWQNLPGPSHVVHQWVPYSGLGDDPTLALANAMNRLAAAIEEHNELVRVNARRLIDAPVA